MGFEILGLDYYSNRLPSTFNNFFKSINKVHQYATRLASKKSHYLLKARTKYGKFIYISMGLTLECCERRSTCKISESFLKAFKRICPLQTLIGVLYMPLIMCKAVVLACLFVDWYVYLFIYYSLYISSLCVFVCICLFITTLIL